MKLSKFDYIMLYAIGIILTFTVSFNAAIKIFDRKSSKIEINADKVTSAKIIEKILSEDTRIILRLMKDNKELISKDVIIKEVKNFIAGDISLRKLIEYYERKNYKLFQDSGSEIIFIKETEFIPQKYYLGSTDSEFIAIFKCDNEGNLYIEDPDNDISNRTLEMLPQQYQKYLQKFELQFETKEEAIEELMAISS